MWKHTAKAEQIICMKIRKIRKNKIKSNKSRVQSQFIVTLIVATVYENLL